MRDSELGIDSPTVGEARALTLVLAVGEGLGSGGDLVAERFRGLLG